MPPTIKAEILEMLQELLRDASTRGGKVNHERLLANIHAELHNIPKVCPVCKQGGTMTLVPRDDRYCATCERCIP